METCPVCHFKTVHERTVRDPKTSEVIETSSVCSNCGHVVRTTKVEVK